MHSHKHLKSLLPCYGMILQITGLFALLKTFLKLFLLILLLLQGMSQEGGGRFFPINHSATAFGNAPHLSHVAQTELGRRWP